MALGRSQPLAAELSVLTALLGLWGGVSGLDASKKAAYKRFFPKYPGFHLKGMKQVGGMRGAIIYTDPEHSDVENTSPSTPGFISQGLEAGQ